MSVSVQRRHDRIELAVADTGIGIAEADLPRLGDPFFQAGSAYSRSTKAPASGCRWCAASSASTRASSTIESADGDGTAVTVSLPIDCRGGGRRGGRATYTRSRAGRRRPTCSRWA